MEQHRFGLHANAVRLELSGHAKDVKKRASIPTVAEPMDLIKRITGWSEPWAHHKLSCRPECSSRLRRRKGPCDASTTTAVEHDGATVGEYLGCCSQIRVTAAKRSWAGMGPR